jgi:hypothetical protein
MANYFVQEFRIHSVYDRGDLEIFQCRYAIPNLVEAI